MESGPIISWQIDGQTIETVTDFITLGSKITVNGDCSQEIKTHLLLGRKDNIFADILRAALSQHHVLRFEIVQLEFHHLY